MDKHSLGFSIVGIGVLLVATGLVVAYGGFSWFGRLPGDFRFGSDNTRVFVPLTSMLVVSLLLTLALSALGRFLS